MKKIIIISLLLCFVLSGCSWFDKNQVNETFIPEDNKNTPPASLQENKSNEKEIIYPDDISQLSGVTALMYTIKPWWQMYENVLPEIEIKDFKLYDKMKLEFFIEDYNGSVSYKEIRQIKHPHSQCHQLFVDPYYDLNFSEKSNEIIVTKNDLQTMIIGDEDTQKYRIIKRCGEQCMYDDVIWKGCSDFFVIGNREVDEKDVKYYRPFIFYFDLDNLIIVRYFGPLISNDKYDQINNYWYYKFNQKLAQLLPEEMRPKKIEDDSVWQDFNVTLTKGMRYHGYALSEDQEKLVYSETKLDELDDGNYSDYRVYLKKKDSSAELLFKCYQEWKNDLCGVPFDWVNNEVVLFEDWAIYGGHGGMAGGYLSAINLNDKKSLLNLSSSFYKLTPDKTKIIYLEQDYDYPMDCCGHGSINYGKIVAKDVLTNKILFEESIENYWYSIIDIDNQKFSFSKVLTSFDTAENCCIKFSEDKETIELKFNELNN